MTKALPHIILMTTGWPWRFQPRSKVIADPEPMLLKQSKPKCSKMDQSTPGTEPNTGVPLTLCQPINYLDIEHDSCSHFAVLINEKNKVRSRNSVTQRALYKINSSWGQSSVNRTTVRYELDQSHPLCTRRSDFRHLAKTESLSLYDCTFNK